MSFSFSTETPSPDSAVDAVINQANRLFVFPFSQMETDEVIEVVVLCDVAGFIRFEAAGTFINTHPDPGDLGGVPIDPGITDDPGFNKQRLKAGGGHRVVESRLTRVRMETKGDPANLNLQARLV